MPGLCIESIYFRAVKMGKGCVHLDNFKERHGIKTYEIIHTIFVVCDTPEAKRSKVIFYDLFSFVAVDKCDESVLFTLCLEVMTV